MWRALPWALAAMLSGQPPDDRLALIGGTIYIDPSASPIGGGVVLVDGGKIAAVGRRVAIPRGARKVDCTGLTILAGFWNSHVHFFERKWADAGSLPAPELGRQIEEMLTRYGFTSVFDLGSPAEITRRIRDRIESGEVNGPSIRSTGGALTPPSPALPSEAVLGILGVMTPSPIEIADAAQASAAARRLLGAGADGLKLFASTGARPMAPEAIRAAVEEAHRAGKPVFAHPNTIADVRAAVEGGVDVVVHTTPRSAPWDEALISAMAARRVALIPTLQIWRYQARHDRASAQDRVVETSSAQLRAWVSAGGEVLFGTDVGAVDYDPSEEYELMSRAGMSFRQILASLTTAPARRFGGSGRIAAGAPADLVVVRGDPSRDARALAAVRFTLRAGRMIYRGE
jgi:imidazolonepropionase-like amidohydrolase